MHLINVQTFWVTRTKQTFYTIFVQAKTEQRLQTGKQQWLLQRCGEMKGGIITPKRPYIRHNFQFRAKLRLGGRLDFAQPIKSSNREQSIVFKER